MALEFNRAAILGATGPTGLHLARALHARGVALRVISRSEAHLAGAFAQMDVERMAADALDDHGLRHALAGCDLVFDCIGLPMERIADHPVTARNLAAAIGATGARAVHVSSFWAYLPLRRVPLDESHPRSGGNLAVRMRREAEDILRGAGAAVINLPDFYGPQVHVSTLQQALAEAARGGTMHWIGSPALEREYVYVPDAMAAVAELALREQAYGSHWIVPGAGPISAARIAAIAGARLGRRVRVRGLGVTRLHLLSAFMGGLRAFMPMVPYYRAAVRYDGTRLRELLGEVPVTPYEEGVARTLEWLAGAG